MAFDGGFGSSVLHLKCGSYICKLCFCSSEVCLRKKLFLVSTDSLDTIKTQHYYGPRVGF